MKSARLYCAKFYDVWGWQISRFTFTWPNVSQRHHIIWFLYKREQSSRKHISKTSHKRWFLEWYLMLLRCYEISVATQVFDSKISTRTSFHGISWASSAFWMAKIIHILNSWSLCRFHVHVPICHHIFFGKKYRCDHIVVFMIQEDASFGLDDVLDNQEVLRFKVICRVTWKWMFFSTSAFPERDSCCWHKYFAKRSNVLCKLLPNFLDMER